MILRLVACLLVGGLALAACSYLFGREQPTPGIVDPATVLQFTWFEGRGGYGVSVPVGATIIERDDGVRVEYSDTSIIHGSLILELAILETPAASSARELLATITADAPRASPIEAIPDSRMEGVMRSYDGPPGAVCGETRLLHAAFLIGARGYSLIIRSDARDRCDAAAIPQALPIVQGFAAPVDGE